MENIHWNDFKKVVIRAGTIVEAKDFKTPLDVSEFNNTFILKISLYPSLLKSATPIALVLSLPVPN